MSVKTASIVTPWHVSLLAGALFFAGQSALSYAPTTQAADAFAAGNDWPYYNGSPAGTHYSKLTDINTGNVGKLAVAWTYDHPDNQIAGAELESNPLIVNEHLFSVSARGRLICLDGTTGRELWTFDPAAGRPVNTRQRKRGLSYWTDGVRERIFFTFRGELLAVEAHTGQLAAEFGHNGRVDLRIGLKRDPETITVSYNSPPAVYHDLVIIGSTGNAPGDIRALDARTGELRWLFHTIPHPGEYGYESWPKDAWRTAMGANCWAGFSVDTKRGLLFVPTASGGMNDKDIYGADRTGDNLFASSLVALHAGTGTRAWHFQVVRHDVWDRDVPAPPTLVTVEQKGRRIDAVALITKSGYVFVLDRDTGRPLFPVMRRSALASDVPGENTAATQVAPLLPAPFARQQLTADLLTRRTAAAHKAVSREFAELRSHGLFDPPSLQGTIEFPGTDGGGEWGGAAYDPNLGLLFVNSNEMAWILKLKPRPPLASGTDGRTLYLSYCATCHREDLRGVPPQIPPLTNIWNRLSMDDIALQISNGGGRMPAFPQLSWEQERAVISYLFSDASSASTVVETAPVRRNLGFGAGGELYTFYGYEKFLDPDGYPAIAPPWGTLSAIDLNTGRYVWKIPFGEYPELAAKGLKDTGSENYGGALVTAGGLLFIGATVYDNKFRAYDERTGTLLWQVALPAPGTATPATYRAQGRQFVVIAASNGKRSLSPSAGRLIAFALPN